MFIETEGTPNPATLKFLPGRDVMGTAGTADFASAEAAGRSPLATRLFALRGVARVFLGADFVTVTQTDEAEWVRCARRCWARSWSTSCPASRCWRGWRGRAWTRISTPPTARSSAQIKELLDTRVRPAVAGDGGDIVFRGFRDGIVKLHMQGACSGCPSSRATLKHGVENMLRHYVPEVVAVEQVEA